MELFSGLKKAYDAVGAEINRTFDSSLAEEGAEPEERSPTPEAVNSPPVMQSSSPEVSRSGGGGGDWNEWEGPAGAWSQGDTWQGGTTTSETVPLPHNLQPSLDHAPNPGGSPATMPSRGMRLSGRTSAEKSKSPTNSERRGNQREEGAGRTDPQSTVAGGTRLDGESGASGSLDRKATSPSSDDSSAKSPKKAKPDAGQKSLDSASPQAKMAEAGGAAGKHVASPLTPSRPTAGGKGGLESLSREELIKYIKKQAVLLQRTKTRVDELNKECEGLRNQATTAVRTDPQAESLMDELQVVRGERDSAMAEWREVKLTTTSLEHDKQQLVLELDRVIQDKSALQECFAQLQNEHSSMQEDISCQLEVGRSQSLAAAQFHSREKDELQQRLADALAALEDERSKVGIEAPDSPDPSWQCEEAVLRASLSEAESVARREEATAEELRGELERLAAGLAASKEECACAGRELATKTQELERLGSEMRATVGTARAEALGEKAAKDACLRELAGAREELGARLRQLEEREAETEAVRADNRHLEEACQGLGEKGAWLENQVALLSGSLEESEGRGHEFDQLQAELAQAYESLRLCSADAETARTEAQTLGVNLSLFQSKITELELKLQDQTLAVDSTHEEYTALQQALEQAALESAGLVSQGRELKAELDSREAELASAVQARADLEARLSEEEQRQTSRLQELEACQLERDSLQSEIASLRASSVAREEEQCALREVGERGEGQRGQEGGVREEGEGLAELQSLRDEMSRAKVRHDQLERERDEFHQAVDTQAVAHKEEVRKLKALILRKKRELTETVEREVQLKQRMVKAEVDQTQLQEVKGQLEEVKGQLKASEAARGALQQEMEGKSVVVETQLQSSKKREEEVGELKAQIERWRSETERCQEREAESSNAVDTISTERNALLSKLQTLSETQELLQSELAAAHSDLATLSSREASLTMATERTEQELMAARSELTREKEGHGTTRERLTAAQKEAKASSLMDLELADYQRSMQSLEARLDERSGELDAARTELRTKEEAVEALREEARGLEQQRAQEEERAGKIKALLKKTRKELEEARKQESELQSTLSTLHSQLEEEKQHSEHTKVEVAQLTAQLLSAQQQSDSSLATHQKTLRALEHKMASLQAEVASLQATLSRCQQDYDSYKVRVHSVLKQKSSVPSQDEVSSELRQKYDAELEQLKTELRNAREHLSSLLTEHDELLTDHEQLSAQHDQLLSDTRDSQDKWQRRYEEAESRHTLFSREQSELIVQLRSEVDTVTEAFKSQLHSVQDGHSRSTTALREELKASQKEVARLQHEADAQVLARATSQEGAANRDSAHSHNLTRSQHPLSHLHSHHDMILSLSQRSQGEGKEQTELESTPSLPPTPFAREDSQLSFERLLSSSDAGGGSHGDASREAQLQKQLQSSAKKTEHLTQVLGESEATAMRLADQAKLLKEEIRRLERNQEREKGVANFEYLKNIILKFLHAEGSERNGLIPIISELLLLSPQEVTFLRETLKGVPAALPSPTGDSPSPGGKGWGSYIHRWTGY